MNVLNLKKTNSHKVEDKLVALASIAAELHSVVDVAWSVSLAGKNAKVISAQAGKAGLGFKPITESIDEVSQQAMNGVNDISRAALELSKISVQEQRSIDAYRRFESVMQKNRDAKYIRSLSEAMRRVEDKMQSSMSAFRKSMNQLTLLMESMDQCMLAARSIASVSRIVTSETSEYRDKLSVVAYDLDKAAIHIKQRLSNSYDLLNNVDLLTNKRG